MRGERQNQNQTRNNDLPRSRALGIIILMFALLLFQVGVFVSEKVFKDDAQHPASPAPGSPASGSPAPGSSVAGPSASGPQPELFHFDPNTIGPDSLCLLGFSEKQALSILKYREKGGRFRKKEDFARMYVVSEEKYAELEPYIIVPAPVLPDKTATGCPSSADKPKPAAGQPAHRAPADSLSSVRREAKPMLGHSASVEQKPPLLIDINAADSVAFTRLYGIGGYYARKIIAYRERLGNFYSTKQLMEIPGIDSAKFEGFARNVTADPADVKRFSLDTAGKSFLIRHPYVGAYAARGILLMREKFGVGACTLENLVKEKILAPATAEKLWFYIENSSF